MLANFSSTTKKALTVFGKIAVNIIYLGQHSIPTQSDLEKV